MKYSILEEKKVCISAGLGRMRFMPVLADRFSWQKS